MSHDNFGSFWSKEDKAVVREKWPELGGCALVPLLQVKRTPRAIEGEAHRQGLKRTSRAGEPTRTGRTSGASKKLERARKSSYGAIKTGPAPSVFHLASNGSKP